MQVEEAAVRGGLAGCGKGPWLDACDRRRPWAVQDGGLLVHDSVREVRQLQLHCHLGVAVSILSLLRKSESLRTQFHNHPCQPAMAHLLPI